MLMYMVCRCHDMHVLGISYEYAMVFMYMVLMCNVTYTYGASVHGSCYLKSMFEVHVCMYHEHYIHV